MDFLRRPSFTRRPVSDGSTVSSCNTCFMTVASSHWVFELDIEEQAHVCDPNVLEYWTALANEIRSKNLELQ